jgi:hypothetical protein
MQQHRDGVSVNIAILNQAYQEVCKSNTTEKHQSQAGAQGRRATLYGVFA